jgi:hypothetical protein
MTLMGWTVSQTNTINKSFHGPNGEFNQKAFKAGIKILAAALPITLIYGLLADWYDEKILGKRFNRRRLAEGNPFAAFVEQAGIMSTFGLYSDLTNAAVNYTRSGDTKGLSLDGRIVAARSLYSLLQAMTTWARQGTATYSTVGRPALMGLGGGGYLQYVEAINNLITPAQGLPLFEQELKVTRKISAENYLRAAGRANNLEVRSGGGAGSGTIPNSSKPWVGEMVLAAYVNDAAGFRQAYRNAIEAAAKDGQEDPVGYVKRSYSARSPFQVFTTRPNEGELRKMYSVMPERGRDDVRDALRLFSHYGEQIGMTPLHLKEEVVRTPLNINLIRAQAFSRIGPSFIR